MQGGQTLGGFGEKSVTHRDYDTGDYKNSDVTGGGKLRLKGPDGEGNADKKGEKAAQEDGLLRVSAFLEA